MADWGRGLAICGATAAVVSLSACVGSQRQSYLMMEHQNVEASTPELRLEVVELSRMVAREIEAAADAVRDGTDDATVRRAALLWKINAIPQVQTAALQLDPLMACVDLWALLVQMQNFFDSGVGAATFGEQAHLAQEAMARAETRFNEGLSRVSRDGGEAARPRIEEWAEAHPIEGFDFRREALGTDVARELRGEGEGGMDAIGDAEASMQRMEYRAALMSEFMPSQMRWNAELTADDLAGAPGIDTTLSNLDQTLVSTGGLAAQLPGMLAGERAALLQGLRAERVAVLGFIDRERQLTFEALAQERIAATKAASELVDRERVATMRDLDELVERRARGVIDFALLRMAQVLGALALIALAIFAFLRWGRTGEGKGGRFWRERRDAGRWSSTHHPGRRASDREQPAYFADARGR
jgi:hypothetical protein